MNYWRGMRGAIVAICAGVLAVGAIVAPATRWTPGATPTPTVDPCASFTFCDEFNGSSVDTSKWTVLNSHGDLGNSELECYTPGNVTESGGVLTETIEHRTFTCGDTTGSNSYPSGAIQTKTFSFTNGTLDVKAKVAGCTGCWPAIWLLGTDCQSPAYMVNGNDPAGCNWPNSGSNEVDVSEFLSSNFTVDWNNVFTAGGTTSHSGSVGTGVDAGDQKFHIYTFVRDASSVTFKVDGVQTNRYTTNLPTGALFLIINTAIGGSGGSVTDATLPATTTVDYVHVT
jgi:beta-glucanase (GH16 family)